MPAADQKVRYRVLAKCFVNDALADPGETKYVWAAPGLQGKALQLAPETAVAAAPLLDVQPAEPQPPASPADTSSAASRRK